MRMGFFLLVPSLLFSFGCYITRHDLDYYLIIIVLLLFLVRLPEALTSEMVFFLWPDF